MAYNKLQFGKDQDWNLNPRDLANVSKALWEAYERPINWQIVSIDSPAAEIEAPVLFLSGSRRWAFTEKEMLKLREYVERGGTILAEPSDHSADFAASMEDLLKNMYPPQSYPDHGLALLPAEHPIYTVIKQDWKNRPRLRRLERLADILLAFRRVHVRRLASQPRRERRLQTGDEPAVLCHRPGRTGREVQHHAAVHAGGQDADGSAHRGSDPSCRHERTPARLGGGCRLLDEAGAAGDSLDGSRPQGSTTSRARQGFSRRGAVAASDWANDLAAFGGRSRQP